MSEKDPAKVAAGQIGAAAKWSREPDRPAATRAARLAFRAKFDPGPEVPEPQRAQMIADGIRAHMLKMQAARRKADRAQADAEEMISEAAMHLEWFVAQAVATAPPLSDRQRENIARLLGIGNAA